MESANGPSVAGATTVQYVIPEIALGGGQYFVNAEIMNEDGDQWDARWLAASFFVPVERLQSGSTYARAEVHEV